MVCLFIGSGGAFKAALGVGSTGGGHALMALDVLFQHKLWTCVSLDHHFFPFSLDPGAGRWGPNVCVFFTRRSMSSSGPV